MAAYIANRGSLEGSKLISEETWEEMHANPKVECENVGYRTNYSDGGVNMYGLPALKRFPSRISQTFG